MKRFWEISLAENILLKKKNELLVADGVVRRVGHFNIHFFEN